ncbi:helix-turn-helix domain-containing protein [Amycolatopsis sp. NPDC051903]|uniref:GbsR/MarR family transcriptional regulator n=1 Tax=Amycolatopsis sp. NPDC051903 TaxID=3363936 RepID=UPI0037A69D1B
MPGSRLTHEDRRTVAEGLSAGLPYAEIARRLGRPTSTVSREIRRNGGSFGYRADRAQEATASRSRRVPADGPALTGFENRFTEMMVHTGLPRMPARVLSALLTSDEAELSAADLVARVRVSPASVSKAVAYLEQLELVLRIRGVSGTRDRYRVDDDAWYRSCRREADVCAAWAGSARLGADLLAGSPAAARLSAMGDYFAHVGRDLADSAERWRHAFGAR